MYHFDEIIDRWNTNAMNTDGFRGYIFHADETMTFPYRDEEFIRMWVADMEFATPDVVIEGIRERLDRRIFGYTKLSSSEYYEAFLRWCENRYSWSFPREEMVMGCGIVPALYELVDYICKPDENVLFLTPSYAYFKYAATFTQKGVVCSDLKNEDGYYTIDFEDFEKKASDPKTTLCIFCNPHNPTGRVWSEEELNRFGEIIQRNGLWVISDEIHCDLLRMGKTHIPLGKVMPRYEKLVTCMAPSKTFNMAGLMISQIMIRSPELRAVWKKRHHDMDNPLSLAGAQAAYEKGSPWLEELRVYLDDNFALTRDYLAENLPKAKFRISEATYLAWVDLSAYFTPEENLPLFFAYKAGVLLEGGNMFVQHSDGFIRLNLACPRSILTEGLKRICDAVNTRHAEPFLSASTENS